MEVYPYDKWATHALPNFEEGEVFIPDVIDLKEGTTSRPSLLTEADLVGLMDKNGIGEFVCHVRLPSLHLGQLLTETCNRYRCNHR